MAGVNGITPSPLMPATSKGKEDTSPPPVALSARSASKVDNEYSVGTGSALRKEALRSSGGDIEQPPQLKSDAPTMTAAQMARGMRPEPAVEKPQRQTSAGSPQTQHAGLAETWKQTKESVWNQTKEVVKDQIKSARESRWVQDRKNEQLTGPVATGLEKVGAMVSAKGGGQEVFSSYAKGGGVGSGELTKLLTDAGASDPSAASAAILKAYDTKTDGRLDASEFSKFVEATQLPRLGRGITARLIAMHPEMLDKNWGLSTGNSYPKDWILQSPEPATNGRTALDGQGACKEAICSKPSGHLADAVGLIRTAKQSVSFATWTEPSAEYTTAINHALRELPPGVNVRMMIGFTNSEDDADRNAKIKTFLSKVTEGVDPRVGVTVGTYNGLKDQGSSDNLKSFSHVKMVVVDGNTAVVGGHNWLEGEYNLPTDRRPGPVYDLSTVTHGPAAGNAEAYFNELWKWTEPSRYLDPQFGWGTVGSQASRAPSTAAPAPGKVEYQPIPDGLKSPAAPSSGGGAILSVGTSGASFVKSPDATSDDAIYGLIDGAKKTLKISQQDLVSMTIGVPEGYKEFNDQTRQHASSELLDHIGAAIKRGVKVQLVLSDGGEGGYQNRPVKDMTKEGKLPKDPKTGASEKGTERYIREHLAAMGIDPNTTNLEVRGLVGVDGLNARNHAKFIMADDEAFYVGSQNLYPGGMADRKKDEAFVALAEFGQIHLDPTKATEMKSAYWDRIWQRSKDWERNHR